MLTAWPHSTRYSAGSRWADVCVCIPLYNYGAFVEEALDSVTEQTLPDLSLIVVDDGSKDDGLEIAVDWARRNADRFAALRILSHDVNGGLPRARNTAIVTSESPFLFFLDADNLMLPRCAAKHLEVIAETDAGMVYGQMMRFGDVDEVGVADFWDRDRFCFSNYVDAMSLIRRSTLVELGGFEVMSVTGWEDYETWCRFIEAGKDGVYIPEILSKYRVHGTSMLKTVSNREANARKLINEMIARHPWLHPLVIPQLGPSA